MLSFTALAVTPGAEIGSKSKLRLTPIDTRETRSPRKQRSKTEFKPRDSDELARDWRETRAVDREMPPD